MALSPERRAEIAAERARRREIIERPFPMVRRLSNSYPWAGTLINRDVEGLRLQQARALSDDDQTFLYTESNNGFSF
jgi:hypothetical protein